MQQRNLRLIPTWLLILASCVTTLFAADTTRPAPNALEQGFLAPPDPIKPWAYWWWIKGNVDEQSITRDLEAMKRQGFGGLLMFDARGYHEDHLPPPPERMAFMGPEWRRLLRFALGEADRLGLKVSVNLSSCGGALRGPWDVGEDAPKQLVWAEQSIASGKRFEGEPPRRGDWSGRTWEIALLAVRQAGAGKTGQPRQVAEVIDLTGKVRDGRLSWDAPSGDWTLLRFAYVLMAGKEIDVDILDPRAVERHFGRMGRPLLADAGSLAGKTLTHFYSVSWEGAAPTWTRDFEAHFQRYRGYALRPWLPALAGLTVKSPELTGRFLRDYNKTLGDCFMDHCYGTLRGLCHQAGLQWHSESGGPRDRKIPSFEDADQLAFLGRNDMPQGEFWLPWRGLTLPVAMAAHIYGRPLAAAEAFTNMQPHWADYPALLKPLADTAFCDGINHLIWHTFTASPPEFGKPGIEYFAGSHLNPNVTWFEQVGPFLKYLARCQFLLRQGRAVNDVCVYTGDRPYLHWDSGRKWSAAPTLTLPKGYGFDLMNTDVLLQRLTVKDGRLVLPEGTSYKLLVVDLEDETIPAPALRKIAELTRAGATVALGQRRPQRVPGLAETPAGDDEVLLLSKELWGAESTRPVATPLGKGKLLRGMTMEAALKNQKIFPDVEGPWSWTHRQAEGADIYFLKGSGAAECTFRAAGREPELWDPMTGRTRDAVTYRETGDGRLIVPLELPENGSVFVVFRRPAETRRLSATAALGKGIEIEGRSKDKKSVALSVWGEGQAQDVKASAPLALAGPWEVRFAPDWGAPESAVFEKLIPWNEHPEAGIKFYSGTATYRKTFELTAAQAQGLARLELGQVKHLATVTVNGKPLGTVWTAPWRAELSGALKPGKNTLEIAVTNTWVNRLIGDAALPEDKRLTKTHARRPLDATDRYARLKGYKADDPLDPSGLLGPVRLDFGTRAERELSEDARSQAAGGEIVLQNAALRAVLGADGLWRSLTLRASGRELIPPGVRVAFASATFDAAPAAQGAGADFDVSTQQALMAAAAGLAKSSPACRARREGDLLTLGFEGTACELALRVAEEPDALIFTIASVAGPRPREVEFARLGVTPLARVGSRLGAAWDDTLAVGLAATNLQTIASARRATNHALLTASTQDSPGPRLEGAGAALVVAPPAQYRAIPAKLAARCPDLPVNEENGVASRELAAARASYWFHSFGEADVERVIADCRKSGIKQIMLTSSAWCSSPGHYLFNTKFYPDGQASLRRTVKRLHDAGILAGMHCYVSKIAKIDPYVSPAPDARFWVDRTAVLAEVVGTSDTLIRTASDLREWPGSPIASQKLWEGGVTKHQEVVIDGEIVQYASIGPEGKWDSFLDCKRGAWKTVAQTHAADAAGRHYAVDGCINGYIIDQETGLLDEVAERLAGIFNDCNFDMVYFDGGEDVDRRRFTYYVSKFQAAAVRRFTKRPIIHMGTIMTHPLWHSFTRSGTVDTYPNTLGAVRQAGKAIDHPPTVREHIDKSVDYLLSVRQDMVPGELGWFGIWPKGKEIEGVQLDEIEYLMTRSLAYDAPISLQTSFRQMDGHPLTSGVLEIVRVYEELRLANAFDEATRAPLREKGVESALVRIGKAWRLVKLGPVAKTAAGVRFSVGELDGGAVAILWGAEQETELTIAMPRAEVRAETIEGEAVGLGEDAAKVALRVGPRRLTLFAPRLAPGELHRRLAGKARTE